MLTKLTIIIAINRFVMIVNFRNHFDKAFKEIFQFCCALMIWLHLSITNAHFKKPKNNHSI